MPVGPEESALRSASPELSELTIYFRNKYGGTASRHVRKLYRMYLDYPTDALVKAVKTALEFKMFDLQRIERMVLKHIAGDFFRIQSEPEDTNYE